MKIKGIRDEDFLQYKKPSMLIIFPYCSWKCGERVCQNNPLKTTPIIDVRISDLIKRYNDNLLTESVVLGGLEPFDSTDELMDFIWEFRKHTEDDIVIYTGYTEDEVKNMKVYSYLHSFPNIIIKFGRYVPDDESHYDEVLGVALASQNQYGKKIS